MFFYPFSLASAISASEVGKQWLYLLDGGWSSLIFSVIIEKYAVIPVILSFL
jgi:hypothetical protein